MDSLHPSKVPVVKSYYVNLVTTDNVFLIRAYSRITIGLSYSKQNLKTEHFDIN